MEKVIMLVPAMTFAWWLVSMSAPAPHPRETTSVDSQPTAEATPTEEQDAQEGATTASEPPAAGATDDSDQIGDTSGERVTLKVVTPAIVKVAKTFLDLPMGSERAVNVEGKRYVFVLERHYHPPGFVGGPNGWHKGVTVYGMR
jgi:hypothetical protein